MCTWHTGYILWWCIQNLKIDHDDTFLDRLLWDVCMFSSHNLQALQLISAESDTFSREL